jgi:hypothetical protein
MSGPTRRSAGIPLLGAFFPRWVLGWFRLEKSRCKELRAFRAFGLPGLVLRGREDVGLFPTELLGGLASACQ